MDRLQVRSTDFSVTKQKAIEDAKKMQASVEDECVKAGKDVPPYLLEELIGKGSYGRVYKATDINTRKIVAVKTIDIDESDTLNPKLADTYSEFLKEVNALKLLSNSGAKNINHVLDALPVGQAMWMVTEYCAGGSVATLMKPTAPGGLQEKWIIPILREVAEAIFWVHKQDIIHRDIKCANVLITEAGAVQLCDFGVAGVIENKFDKRSTFIGTPHWMAPELFDIAFDPAAARSYGTEVDIWAFGAMVYEIASGLPPNVMHGFDITKLGQFLRSHSPRLEGDMYSPQLKDLVAFCLETEPAKRPPIEQVQRHPYIFNSDAEYPTASLANLVKAYKMWEAQGGSRKSLFLVGGAQGPSDYSSTALANDEWNFSTTMDLDQLVMNSPDMQAVYDVYGSNIDFEFNEETSRPAKPKSRRRPPPQLPAIKAPLEKVFDPNTITNYEDNARAYYGNLVPPPTSTSDLPLRDNSLSQTVRESLIDLDISLDGDDLSHSADAETIRAGPHFSTTDYDSEDMPDYSKPPLSDPADLKNNRRTQDWKFPVMAPASANTETFRPEMFRFPFKDDQSAVTSNVASSSVSVPASVSGSSNRPALIHHPTEPAGLPSQGYDLVVSRAQDNNPTRAPDNRASMSSLIDLDESLPTTIPELTRPSTANSDVTSVSGSDIVGANPFDLERHASLYDSVPISTREPSIYVSDSSDLVTQLAREPDDITGGNEVYRHAINGNGNGSIDSSSTNGTHGRNSSYGDDGYMANGYSTNGYSANGYSANGYSANGYLSNDYMDPDYLTMEPTRPPPPPHAHSDMQPQPQTQARQVLGEDGPPIPDPPSVAAMQGLVGREEVRDELTRMLDSLMEHLSHAEFYVTALSARKATRHGAEGDQG